MTWGYMGEYVHRQIFLTFLLLFLNLFKLRIGILPGSQRIQDEICVYASLDKY